MLIIRKLSTAHDFDTNHLVYDQITGFAILPTLPAASIPGESVKQRDSVNKRHKQQYYSIISQHPHPPHQEDESHCSPLTILTLSERHGSEPAESFQKIDVNNVNVLTTAPGILPPPPQTFCIGTSPQLESSEQASVISPRIDPEAPLTLRGGGLVFRLRYQREAVLGNHGHLYKTQKPEQKNHQGS